VEGQRAHHHHGRGAVDQAAQGDFLFPGEERRGPPAVRVFEREAGPGEDEEAHHHQGVRDAEVLGHALAALGCLRERHHRPGDGGQDLAPERSGEISPIMAAARPAKAPRAPPLSGARRGLSFSLSRVNPRSQPPSRTAGDGGGGLDYCTCPVPIPSKPVTWHGPCPFGCMIVSAGRYVMKPFSRTTLPAPSRIKLSAP
jgi:hypothetical protein